MLKKALTLFNTWQALKKQYWIFYVWLDFEINYTHCCFYIDVVFSTVAIFLICCRCCPSIVVFNSCCSDCRFMIFVRCIHFPADRCHNCKSVDSNSTEKVNAIDR